MATLSEDCFDRKAQEAEATAAGYPSSMINSVMNRAEWGLLIALALIWGVAFVFIKVAVTHVEPLTYVWLRLLMAAAALWAWMRWRGERINLSLPIWGAILLLALLNNVIPFVLFGWGQRYIASGLGSILNATTPIWGALVAHWATSDERMNASKLLGVLVGFAGVAVMIGPSLLTMGGDTMPQLACLIAAFCYAKVATGQLIAGLLVMTPIALLVDQPWNNPLPPMDAWGAMILLALICTAYAYVLYFKLIASAGATNALLVTLLVPPVAIIFGAILLGEALTGGQFLGLAFIALGLAVIDGRAFSAIRKKAVA
jgi:drug/metabolite transporter (DMT)-like permease